MSCLFNSLSHFIPEDSHTIRQKICDYLQNNNPIIDGMQTSEVLEIETGSLDVYIQRMRLTSTWGGAIEIQAACNIWNLKINVSNYRDTGNRVIEFVPLHENVERSVGIYWTGGHYEPIR
jgi:hypothetical protein